VPAREPPTAPSGRSLSTRILIGLAAGVAVGLFVDERAAVLQPIADGYDLFARWILGQDSTPKPSRWSIMDDVLGW
jgi:hypothetical protein